MDAVRAGLVLAAAAAALASCSRPPAHDKAFFAAHASARAQQLAACQADPGRMAGRTDCINAQAADADAHAARFYDAPRPVARVRAPGQI